MKAAVYEQFQGPMSVQNVPDPTLTDNGIILQVKATGICRSDWHGWMGHIGIIQLPHIPGHEMAGIVAKVGKNVTRHKVGDRVTLPFCCGCGICEQCLSGNSQVCENQFVPGFTARGSYAEYVAIGRADDNVFPLPEEIDFVTAASLGCRFITSFRAVKRKKDLEMFQNTTERYKDVNTLLTDLALEPPNESVVDVESPGPEDEFLTLSTIHSAKGLEWNSVFIIYALEGGFPTMRSVASDEEIEEERRLMYVACTRAKDNLFITYPMNVYDRESGLILTKPSRFIQGIGDQLLEQWVVG